MEKNKRNSDNLLKNFFKCKLENVQHFKNRNNPEFKNSCSQRFFKIRFPKNFTEKFTEKRACWSLFPIKMPSAC